MRGAIEVDGLVKRYGRLEALRGIDLTIAEGEFFGLLGPNGAGKSTLIAILAGLTRADAGQARVMGHDVVTDYRRSRAALGVVPQELVFDPFFCVRELLELQAGYFGLSRRRAGPWIDRLLEGLGLADKARSNMRALSGGMKRRVLIAQALVHKPPVVILDEPTAGVDVELRASLWEFVRELHREGHTIVLTTHYLEEAEQLCQRIAIIDRGRIIALDDKEALLARGAGTRRTLRVVLARPLERLPEGLDGRLEEHAVEVTLEPGGPGVVAILDALRGGGAEIVDLEIEEPDLEDVFIELTRRES